MSGNNKSKTQIDNYPNQSFLSNKIKELDLLSEENYNKANIINHLDKLLENHKANDSQKSNLNNNISNNIHNYNNIMIDNINNDNNNYKKYQISNENKNSKISNDSMKINYNQNNNDINILSNSVNNTITNPQISNINESEFNPKCNITSNKNIINLINSNIPLQDQQKKEDFKRKTEISIKHSVILSDYYENTPGEEESKIDQLLEEMSIYGDITKKEIEIEKSKNPDYYISIEKAIDKSNKSENSDFKNEYFILSILAKALMRQGCTVAIERNPPNDKDKNHEINTTVQFLVNGMYNFKKYIFYFDFGDEKNKEILKNKKELNNFNLKLKKKLLSLFGLNENDIIMSDPRLDPYTITSIIKKEKFKKLSKEKIFQELKEDPEFNQIKEVEHCILLSGCKLNPYMMDSLGNNKDGGWGINEIRGGLPYLPPLGWCGYGLRVLNRFDKGDNTWFDYKNSKGEWCVAYHGLGNSLGGSQILNNFELNSLNTGIKKEFENSNDKNHPGEKVGEGIYVTPNPKVMEEICGIYNFERKKYKIAFMTRVHPKKIRIPEKKPDYWVINGTDNEIRPYRILIKEV